MSNTPPDRGHVAFRLGPVGELPADVKRDFDAAVRESHKLFMQSWQGPHQLTACRQLMLLGEVICAHLESLWRDPARRTIVEAAAMHTNHFPLIHTNVEGNRCSDEMREGLRLRPVPGGERDRRGPKARDDALNVALHEFILGVITPGTLLFVRRVTVAHPITGETNATNDERDIVNPETRAALLQEGEFTPGHYVDAFADYVRQYRSDLLSEDGESGECAERAKEQRDDLQAKNPDEKSVWRAFKKIVAERIRKFRPLIESAIPTK